MKDEIIFWRTMTPREVISCHHGTLFLIYPLHLLQGRAIDILQREAVRGVRRRAPGGARLPTEDDSLLF